MRPVDADEYKKLMENKSRQVWEQVLDDTPTLEWGVECEMIPTGFFNRLGVCSNCGGYIVRKTDPKYCPHCGARVINEEEWF